jgi:NhaP-type Na+/H+ or K+/H+ antiporter
MGVAIGVGVVIGAVAARVLRRVMDAGWTQPSALRIGVLTLPLLAYGTAVLLGGNGFVAAFVAGLLFEPAARHLPAGTLHLVEDVGYLLSLALWFMFGALVNDTLAGGSITWQIVLYAVLALSVVRVLPVALSLLGTEIAPRDRLVVGAMGPRCVATLVFGLLAFIQLPDPENDLVLTVTVVTVVASIVIHGLSTGLVTRMYGRSAEAPPDEPGTDAPPAVRRGPWARWRR